jgi:hypothetical protein
VVATELPAAGRDLAMVGALLVAILLGALDLTSDGRAMDLDRQSPLPPPTAAAAPRLTRVRGVDVEAHKLIARGYELSGTIRVLIDRIQQQKVMVLIQLGDCAKGRFRSCVTNVTRDMHQRHISIKISPRTTTDRLIATIAHELQHVNEILSDPEAIDAESTLALYRRIGIGACREGLSEACETEQAGVVERRVLEEFHAVGGRAQERERSQ